MRENPDLEGIVKYWFCTNVFVGNSIFHWDIGAVILATLVSVSKWRLKQPNYKAIPRAEKQLKLKMSFTLEKPSFALCS